MDDEDRIVKPLNSNNWQFQLEDQLPVPLDHPIFIERHQWHRLIKGNGPLMINITKHARAQTVKKSRKKSPRTTGR